MATKQELKRVLEDLDRKIAVLEWDKMRDQINPSKLASLEELKKQRAKVANDMASAVDEEEKKPADSPSEKEPENPEDAPEDAAE